MHLTTQMHTVFLLVGPTLAGKSTFAQALKQKLQAAGDGVRATLLSSDALRRELLADDTMDRHAQAMMEVSGVAFEQLFSRLSAVTTWPVNHEFVIVDTTGLDETFRNQVRASAEAAAYNVEVVLFDFPHSHYLRAASGEQTPQVLKQVKRFKSEVLPRVRQRDFTRLVRIKARNEDNWAGLTVEVADLAEWQRCRVSADTPLALIGDVHEDIEAAQAILKETEGARPVLVGDWMDKGGDPAGAVALAEQVLAAGGLLIEGNHEHYLYGRVTGSINDGASPEIEETYFTALKTLMADPALAARFCAVVEQALPYLVVKPTSERSSVYVTHAPVLQKFIGKHGKQAKREQRNFRLPVKDSEGIRESLAEVLKEAKPGLPLHVWGHVPHSGPVFSKNHARIDTGAVHGGKLTALVVSSERRIRLAQVDGHKRHDGHIYSLEAPLDAPTEAHIDPEERRTIKKMLAAGIRYLSGTMAPAPSENGKLEPLSAGLEAMRKSGATQVVLEPKYMGSRAQVYLFKNQPEKTFAVSRNGYVMRQPTLQPALDAVFAQFNDATFWSETLILDGEMMPWHAVGHSLIERDFQQYGAAVRAELTALADDPVFAGFEVGQSLNLPTRLDSLAVFDRQLEIYGQDGEPHYKPFTILAADGVVWVERDQSEVFRMVAPDEPLLVLDLNAPDALEQAEAFFASLTVERQMEGVVIKPTCFAEGMLPYVKVRNEDYLTIIYGYDYKMRYDRMCASKKVRRKSELSRKEFALGNRLLAEPDLEVQIRLMAELRQEIAQEAELDPRL